MKSSTQDKIEGKVREVTGAMKEKLGQARRDPIQEEEGTDQKMAGKIQSKVGDIKKVFDR